MSDPAHTHPQEREVFFEAVEITDSEARATFLAEACGADTHLRTRVEKLLEAESDPSLIRPAPEIRKVVENLKPEREREKDSRSLPTGGWQPPLPETLDSLLEAYEVKELIGRG